MQKSICVQRTGLYSENKSCASFELIGSRRAFRSVCQCLRQREFESAAKEFEAYARDCVRMAGEADSPHLRQRLLAMAREWMQAVIEEEQLLSQRAGSTTTPRYPLAH